MRKVFRNIAILLSPFLAMILVNELVRPGIKTEPYQVQGMKAINSSIKIQGKCSWICHNNTLYCKQNHVKSSSKLLPFTDPIYGGVINSLKATGNYALANILLFTIVIPLSMFFILVKTLDMQSQIRSLKKKEIANE